ncbi:MULTISPECIES: helix-turn-helix domain-containing protein [unclassified Fibrobacter]|uniref:helix-turn-helix domain-containing protein n=1 Tax=unclassified Fibrobacter TaxID=2634177 RepID=UPI00091A6B65|nr:MULTISPECIES: helix-turn-helix transcriptional regulator [unclassified Fibrobacter]SHK61830.1 Helix-turn-helix [Fibrobacter sp. UWB12]SIN95771.1 Helix-turn-helix [Fibrobacter sp. UWB11]
MRYDIDVIQKAEKELLAQMQGATSLTKKRLSLDSGISRQHLGLIAKGKRNFSLKSFCDLADAFGCTATELMAKLEAIMMELVKLQVSMAADKTKGINYVKSTSGKNAQKPSKELKDGKKL